VLRGGRAGGVRCGRGEQPADGGPGNSGFYGNVTCDQSYSPQCDVTAGSSPSAGTPASGGPQAGGQPAAGTAAAGGAGGCAGTVNKTFGCVPAGCQVTVQTLACPIGAAPAGAPAAGPGPPDPAVLAALARQTLGLPSPVIRSSPAQAALQPTNLPTWLWIDPAEWVPESKTATVPGESVTATATPVSVTWHPGDGSTVTCQGAGGAGGALAPLFTTAVAAFRVAESQALNTSGT
jgi:hypothetical protein